MLPHRGGQPDRKPDREHRALLGDRDPAACGGLGDVAAGLALRAAQPPGQQPCRLRSRSPGFQQDGGLVDVRRVLRGARAAIPRHDMKILQIMSSSRRKPPACPMIPLTGPAPPPAPARSSDATVSAVDVSSPHSHPATRRSQAPSSTPSRTPARIADRSSPGTNPPGPAPAAPPAPRRSPAPLQPPVTQRSLEAEVAFCVGGVLSPLLANIALSALDDHFDRQWHQEMGTEYQRAKRKRNGHGNWRLSATRTILS